MSGAPSPWVVRWSHLVPSGSTVLDLACGAGRHAQWFVSRGCTVTAVDRDTSAIRITDFSGEIIEADLESGPWPLKDAHGVPRKFDAIVVTNYLHRPLFPVLVSSLSDNGILMYETFAQGNAQYGRPSRADFLLQHGELLLACEALHTVAFEQGYVANPPKVVQRIVAARATQQTGTGIGASDNSNRLYALHAG